VLLQRLGQPVGVRRWRHRQREGLADARQQQDNPNQQQKRDCQEGPHRAIRHRWPPGRCTEGKDESGTLSRAVDIRRRCHSLDVTLQLAAPSPHEAECGHGFQPEVTRRVTADRPISPAEITLIHAMLERAALEPAYRRLVEGIESLRVIARCSCGCDSVDFNVRGQGCHPTPIADGTGETAAGGKVGVLIWGTAESVVGIEVRLRCWPR
jgi:hypothetical protein